MTFQEAKEILRDMAEGEMFELKYKYTEYNKHSEEAECGVYISGHDWCYGDRWDSALTQMSREMGEETSVDNGEAPE